jgi:hypothetical protein
MSTRHGSQVRGHVHVLSLLLTLSPKTATLDISSTIPLKDLGQLAVHMASALGHSTSKEIYSEQNPTVEESSLCFQVSKE